MCEVMANFYKFESEEKGRKTLQRLGYNVLENGCILSSKVPKNYPRHTEPDNKNPFSMAYLCEMGRLIPNSFTDDPILMRSQRELESALDKLGISSFEEPLLSQEQ